MGDDREGFRGGLLSEDEARRLLSRAVELDARHRAAVSVEDLEAAAREAGIEPRAFAQALDELRSGALEPVTIGRRVSTKLGRYRGLAALGALVASAGITFGDTVGLTLVLGFGLYGAYEGLVALARYWGETPPRVPPNPDRVAMSREDESRGSGNDMARAGLMSWAALGAS